jgi:GNAT superfamily N-acetyltransferase
VSGSDGYRIREAAEADIPALARLHVQTFNETHKPLFRKPSYALRESQWRNSFLNQDGSWFCFVAEDAEGNLVGFAKGVVPEGKEGDYEGILNKIYTLRKHQRHGLGRKLLCAVARRFVGMGVNSMRLFGWARNPNNRFYEVMGAERICGENGEFGGGYGWTDLTPLANLSTEAE